MMKAECRNRFDYVVLNSVGMANKAIPILRQYKSVRCYLDNDAAGRNVSKIYQEQLGAIDCSEHFKDYNDVNEYLCKGINPTTSEQDV